MSAITTCAHTHHLNLPIAFKINGITLGDFIATLLTIKSKIILQVDMPLHIDALASIGYYSTTANGSFASGWQGFPLIHSMTRNTPR